MQPTLIIGSGTVGEYLIPRLLKHGSVEAWRRQHLPSAIENAMLKRVAYDLDAAECDFPLQPDAPYTLIYSAPPNPIDHDARLSAFLKRLKARPRRVIYLSSTGVYGNHQGAWVNEESATLGHEAWHLARLDAEQQWTAYFKDAPERLLVCRITGIYGPNRLHLKRLQDRRPLIVPHESPYSNRIHVDDLADVITMCCQRQDVHGILNICDGHVGTFTQWYELLAEITGLPISGYLSAEDIFAQASSFERSFMQSSRCIDTGKLTSLLEQPLKYSDWHTGILAALKASTQDIYGHL